jgi:hypothetical protein
MPRAARQIMIRETAALRTRVYEGVEGVRRSTDGAVSLVRSMRRMLQGLHDGHCTRYADMQQMEAGRSERKTVA